jgi:hypothetical protein
VKVGEMMDEKEGGKEGKRRGENIITHFSLSHPFLSYY